MVIRGRHVLIGLLSAFGVILIANGTFVYFATRTFPGNDVSDAYRRGLAYNETLAADARQQEMGWSATVRLQADGVEIDLRDAASGPVSGLSLAGELRRPGRRDLDRVVQFSERQPGIYVATVELAPGRWNLSALAAGLETAPLFRVRESLEVTAP